MGMTPRVALVVGAGRGIGRAVAERLAREGHVIIVAARSAAEVQVAAEAICRAGGRADARTLDITDPALTDRAVQDIREAHGGLDILVNSAGMSYIAPVPFADPARWREVLEVNLLGAFIISRAVVRRMVGAHWGRIVHIGSIAARLGAPYNAIYAASKAGVEALVRSLALEVAPAGVTVNAVAPGYVRTQLFAYTQGERAKLKGVPLEHHEEDLLAEMPTRRLVEPAEVAAAVAYLVSEEAGSVTGHVLNVDGGRTAC